jgi:hypothetical protein
MDQDTSTHAPAISQGTIDGLDVVPGASVWGFAMFLSAEPIEVTLSIGSETRRLVGQNSGSRLVQFSFQKKGAAATRVVSRGKAVADNLPLSVSGFRGVGGESMIVGFSLLGTPRQSASNPATVHDVVVALFQVFDKT